ncbi:MAG: 6-phospho-3-hexuloisomerase, partial [Lachnospiraceae bacterium]|nr:6-phospho-3-hexuloisomerase [Lachnospiraceae bacterium]
MNLNETYQELYTAILKEHEAIFQKQDLTELDAFMELIIKAGRIFVMGVGREGIAARAFAMRLMH